MVALTTELAVLVVVCESEDDAVWDADPEEDADALTEPDEEGLAETLTLSAADDVSVGVWTGVVVGVAPVVRVAVRLWEKVATALVDPVRRGVIEPDEDPVEVRETLTVRECVPDVEPVLETVLEADAVVVVVEVRVSAVDRVGVPVRDEERLAETVEVPVRVLNPDWVDVAVPVSLFVGRVETDTVFVPVNAELLDALRLLGPEKDSDAVVVLVRVADADVLIDFVDDNDASPVGMAVGVRVEVAERVEHAEELAERVACIDRVRVGEAEAEREGGAVRVLVKDTIGLIEAPLELV